MPRKTCFVIGPIGDDGSDTRRHADWLLEGIIAPVLADFEFDVQRSDRIAKPGMIDSQIINHVIDADLVIADLSNRNPNAFYELAIRHMEERPIIHMIHKSELLLIPFDVRPFRTVLFSWDSPKELEQSKLDLKSYVRSAISTDHEVDNPVTRARGHQNLTKTATPTETMLFREIDDVKVSLRELQVLVSYRRNPLAAAFAPENQFNRMPL
jgi:hypothetical protein